MCVHAQVEGGTVGKDHPADFPLNAKLDAGLDTMTPRSLPELKPGAGCLLD